MEIRERRVAVGLRRCNPRVGCIGLAEGSLAIDRQPGVEGVVLALGSGEMRFGEFALRKLARPQTGRHLVGKQARDALRSGHPGPTRR